MFYSTQYTHKLNHISTNIIIKKTGYPWYYLTPSIQKTLGEIRTKANNADQAGLSTRWYYSGVKPTTPVGGSHSEKRLRTNEILMTGKNKHRDCIYGADVAEKRCWRLLTSKCDFAIMAILKLAPWCLLVTLAMEEVIYEGKYLLLPTKTRRRNMSIY